MPFWEEELFIEMGSTVGGERQLLALFLLLNFGSLLLRPEQDEEEPFWEVNMFWARGEELGLGPTWSPSTLLIQGPTTLAGGSMPIFPISLCIQSLLLKYRNLLPGEFQSTRIDYPH